MLGVIAFLIQFVLHVCFRLDVWGTGETTEAARVQTSLNCMSSELPAYYKTLKRSGVNPTEVQDITPGMVGGGKSKTWGVKAAETAHLLLYVRGLLVKHRGVFAMADETLAACDALVQMQELIKQHPDVFPPGASKESLPGK